MNEPIFVALNRCRRSVGMGVSGRGNIERRRGQVKGLVRGSWHLYGSVYVCVCVCVWLNVSKP